MDLPARDLPAREDPPSSPLQLSAGRWSGLETKGLAHVLAAPDEWHFGCHHCQEQGIGVEWQAGHV